MADADVVESDAPSASSMCGNWLVEVGSHLDGLTIHRLDGTLATVTVTVTSRTATTHHCCCFLCFETRGEDAKTGPLPDQRGTGSHLLHPTYFNAAVVVVEVVDVNQYVHFAYRRGTRTVTHL